MWRSIVAILLTPVVWGMISVPANLLLSSFFSVEAGIYPTAYLWLSILFSLGYSFIAGYCAAWLAQSNTIPIAVSSGVALLIVGLAVQISNWDTLPIWYHLVFLSLLIPLCVLGARSRSTAQSTAAEV